jgi:hypothetical protein
MVRSRRKQGRPGISPTNRDSYISTLLENRAGLFGEDGVTKSPTNPDDYLDRTDGDLTISLAD